jgi:hypothetical protein
MATKRIKCRAHGGWFTVEARRGRPPVKCTEGNKCDAQTIQSSSPTKARTAQQTMPVQERQSRTLTSVATHVRSNASATGDRAEWVEGRAATTKEINRLFRQVIELGWDAKRAWLDETHAEITAVRGEEMLYIVVTGGQTIHQQYSLWHFDKPSLNARPAHSLPFDPDEIGDGELARLLVGTKVTWYNRLSGKEETAYCGKESIRIEHGYNALGDELPGERVIKFIDADRLNFRAFRLDALLKVGK